jgi:hypothetical protein
MPLSRKRFVSFERSGWYFYVKFVRSQLVRSRSLRQQQTVINNREQLLHSKWTIRVDWSAQLCGHVSNSLHGIQGARGIFLSDFFAMKLTATPRCRPPFLNVLSIVCRVRKRVDETNRDDDHELLPGVVRSVSMMYQWCINDVSMMATLNSDWWTPLLRHLSTLLETSRTHREWTIRLQICLLEKVIKLQWQEHSNAVPTPEDLRPIWLEVCHVVTLLQQPCRSAFC